MVVDRFGRPVTSVRISLTQRCNLACIYCHREGEQAAHEEMTVEEVSRIVEAAASLGISKVKLTGGEPLLREDILDIVSAISSTPGVEEVSMTTNGVLLRDMAWKLREAGLKRVNVGLCSLREDTYKRICGRGSPDVVLEGVKAAVEAGLNPVKVNMVVLKGLNEDEVWEMLRFTSSLGVILQIIELEYVPGSVDRDVYERLHADLTPVEKLLSDRALRVFVRGDMHNRRRYTLPDGEVEVVKPMHNREFCMHCRRIRVTSDGKLKPCLMRNDNLVDLLGPLRAGAGLEEVKRLFEKAISLREPYFR